MRDRRLQEVLDYLDNKADKMKDREPRKAAGIMFAITEINKADQEGKQSRERKRMKKANKTMQSSGTL